jgi:hypothetical protein
MKRRLLAGSALLAAISAAALSGDLPSAWRAWRYSRRIQTTPATSPTFCQVHLSAGVFPHSDNLLGDLRVIAENGSEVPYSLSVENSGIKVESRRADLRENSYVPGQYTQVLLDLGKQPLFHNAVKIATPETNFINWVEIAAADDARVWRIVKTRAPISRFRQENFEGSQIVRYSENNARYLRVRILETARQFPVTDADVYFTSEIEPAREIVPVNLASDPSAPNSVTRWNADFDLAPWPVKEIAFETVQPEFFRAVRVQTSEDAKVWSVSPSAGEIYRYKVGDKLEDSLRVPLYGGRGLRHLRFEVLNQNDAPLEGVSAQFLMNSLKLYFEQKPGHNYRLL